MQDTYLTHQPAQEFAVRARRFMRRHGGVRSSAYLGLNLVRIVTDTPTTGPPDVPAGRRVDIDAPMGWGT
jgi:hypothetical protein